MSKQLNLLRIVRTFSFLIIFVFAMSLFSTKNPEQIQPTMTPGITLMPLINFLCRTNYSISGVLLL